MLYQVKYTPKIGRNVIKAFKEIHVRRVYHGDVRGENILVRSDQSVVVVDFELSEMDVEEENLETEMREVKSLIASLKNSAQEN
jgi:tRNA A-37 threonylcarbamoyl transferase component Bud32